MWIDNHIERGHTIVCASVRLVHRFRHLHAQEQLRQGRRAWETPDILPYQAWLRRCWATLRERNGDGRLLLNGAQEEALWQRIIDRSEHKHSFLRAASVAGQVAAAWRSLKQYQAPIFPRGTPMNEDSVAFKSWADEFRLRCGRNGWIDSASLADVLRESVGGATQGGVGGVTHESVGGATHGGVGGATNGGVGGATDIFGEGLALAGFDQLTPQQAALMKTLEDAGIAVHEYRQEDCNVSAQTLDFADADEEIRAAAVWARKCIEEDGGISVGIITPELRKLRTRIRYIFEDVLAPGNLGYRDAAAPLPFSISAGQALVDYPLVNAIFPILGLNGESLPLDTLGFLLRTPFIKGHDEERSGRALLDETLRSRKQLAFSWDDLLYLAGGVGNKGQAIPVMTAILKEIRAILAELPDRQSPEAWADNFSRFLEIFGWPGDRNLDSAEYQLVQSWHSTLDSLVSLRLVNPMMTRPEALAQLRRIAGATGFQPKSAETPIQVLDPQGAAAMAFDRVWMIGLTEDAWPPRPRPNPFVPASLQKKYGMPDADADSSLQQARSLLTALTSATPEIILSHARNEADRPLLASPLLSASQLSAMTNTLMRDGDTALMRDGDTAQMRDGDSDNAAHDNAAEAEAEVESYAQVIFNSRRIESIEDTTAPPVSGRHRGGVSLFRDQSQCPFRAFARHRLHSRELEQADIGLDAMQRGILLHELMEDAWSQLESQEQLAAMTPLEQENLIKTLVADLVTEYGKRYPLVFSRTFAAIEARRLALILAGWLQLELKRAPFAVANVEEDARLDIGDVEFSVRLDRVDALEDGRRVIIDYKGGQASIHAWKGERPDEPQMPLYAVTHPEPVAAVAFASLKRGKNFGFVGLAEAGDILPGIGAFEQDRKAKEFIPTERAAHTEGRARPPTWKELFGNWRGVLEKLAQEFRTGEAAVKPTKPQACQQCEQHLLCRIHEVSPELS